MCCTTVQPWDKYNNDKELFYWAHNERKTKRNGNVLLTVNNKCTHECNAAKPVNGFIVSFWYFQFCSILYDKNATSQNSYYMYNVQCTMNVKHYSFVLLAKAMQSTPYTVHRIVYNSHCFNINIYSKLNIERTFIEAVVGGWTWYVQYPMIWLCVVHHWFGISRRFCIFQTNEWLN